MISRNAGSNNYYKISGVHHNNIVIVSGAHDKIIITISGAHDNNYNYDFWRARQIS